MTKLPPGPEPKRLTARPKPASMRLPLEFLTDSWSIFIEGLTQKLLQQREAVRQWKTSSGHTRKKLQGYTEAYRKRLKAADPERWKAIKAAQNKRYYAKRKARGAAVAEPIIDIRLPCPYCDAAFYNKESILISHISDCHAEKLGAYLEKSRPVGQGQGNSKG